MKNGIDFYGPQGYACSMECGISAVGPKNSYFVVRAAGVGRGLQESRPQPAPGREDREENHGEARAVPIVRAIAMDRLLTVDDLAAWLQVKPRTVYQWVHEGYLPVIKLGSLVRFDQAKVTEWIGKREVPGRTKRRLEIDVN